ncbi:Hypothetical_protein [Hexamita inflata]|uniref:Hypothetical_protein n=1 Tax=Hexamita inflata TaxID=28002 RepID=A0ABP1IKD6_9EUKA
MIFAFAFAKVKMIQWSPEWLQSYEYSQDDVLDLAMCDSTAYQIMPDGTLMNILRMQNPVVNHPLKYKKQIPLSNLIQYSTTKLNSTRAFTQIYYTSKKLSIKIILSQNPARRRQPGGVTVGCENCKLYNGVKQSSWQAHSNNQATVEGSIPMT